MFDKDFMLKEYVTYYNLKGYGGCHSGDIVDAPQGASEFIDVSISKCLELGVRYVLMNVNSYTSQPYIDLPECFAGWMMRQYPDSGEIYEPKTVVDKFDLTADSKIALPVIFDLKERKAIWCDMSLTALPNFSNNVHNNLTGIQLTLKSLVTMNKPNLYDLFSIHVAARGQIVENPEDAQTVFSVEAGTPFELETIASEYMI